MREWLVTNGLGSYASLTYKNTNSRKFHGLLVTSLNPPTKRNVFVSNNLETIIIGNKKFDLLHQPSDFFFDLFPKFFYEIDDVKITKTIFMPQHKNTTIIKYNIETKKPLTFESRPIINFRHFYDVKDKNSFFINQEISDGQVNIKFNDSESKIKILLEESNYNKNEKWIKSIYDIDKTRNDSYIDYNLITGEFVKNIKKNCEFYIVFTNECKLEKHIKEIFNEEINRKKRIIEKANLPKKFDKLVLSSDNFIVKKGNGKSIVAGYHWFSDWGRDTLISLPGITLVTNRFDEAKKILSTFSKFCKKGLIPNAFMDRDSEAVYNTVDASLWFVDRAYQYLKYTNDKKFLEDIWRTLESIISGYKNGTDFNIKMDDDFLISHDKGLTWMDVKIDDYYPTPRDKKAVEIQALWYNSLKIMERLSKILNKDDVYSELALKLKNSFNRQYDRQYDVIDKKDTSFRCNQIFLVSLEYEMIKRNLQKKILSDVEDKLVTIFGLRTLSRDDSRYYGNYIGNHNKDEAYHNGIVWPWLLGQFIKSYVKLDNSRINRNKAFEKFLEPMIDVFGDKWDGSIYEIFDGNPPYIPRGCISQAWSVAEILRSWAEDIEYIRPKYEDLYLQEICI